MNDSDRSLNSTVGAGQHQTGTSAATQADATLDVFLDVAGALQQRVSAALGQVGLSYAKYEVLAHLRAAGGPVSLGLLAAGQKCARSNITQIVDRLEAEGLVRRLSDPDDRRGVLAELTADGATQLEAGAAQLDRVRAEFAESLTDSDRALVRRLLTWIQ